MPGGGIWTPAAAQLWPAATAILRRETYGNYPGALAILKCVYEGLQVPFDTGLKIEQRYFTADPADHRSLLDDPLAVRLDAGTRQGRPSSGRHSGKIQVQAKIGVVGAGFMGASIAYVTAAAGIPVVLSTATWKPPTRARPIPRVW